MAVITNEVKTFPWMEKGEWYHLLIESDGSTYTLTSDKSGKFIISSRYLVYDGDFSVIDVKSAIHSTSATAQSSVSNKCIGSTAHQGVYLPSAASFDYMDVWIFGYAY